MPTGSLKDDLALPPRPAWPRAQGLNLCSAMSHVSQHNTGAAMQRPAQVRQRLIAPASHLSWIWDSSCSVRPSGHWRCEAGYSTEPAWTQTAPNILPEARTGSKCSMESTRRKLGSGRIRADNNWAPAISRQIPCRLWALYSLMLWFLQHVPKIPELLPHGHVGVHWGLTVCFVIHRRRLTFCKAELSQS